MPDGDLNPRAVIGGNNPPPFDADLVAKFNAKTAEFLDVAGQWLDKGDLKSEDDAQRLNDFIAGCRAQKRKIEDARKDAKKPWDDLGKMVQDAFLPLAKRPDTAISRVQPLLTKWMQAQEAKRREEVRKREEEARRQREEAERLAEQAASRNDLVGEMEAQAAKDAAEKAAREAQRAASQTVKVASATGGARSAGLRTYVTAEIVNIHQAMLHYKTAPDLLACIRTLAEREARAKGFDPEKNEIPGIKFNIERRAV